jgi:hypothetical protein
MFVQGCQGDVNPVPEFRESGEPDVWAPIVEKYARMLAAATARVFEDAAPVDGGVVVQPAGAVRVAVGDTLLARLAGREKTRIVELLRWSIGGVTMLAIPGEGFHAVEQALRASHGDRLLLVGLAPEWHGYLPRPYTDGYEEGLSLGPDAVDTLVAALSSSWER